MIIIGQGMIANAFKNCKVKDDNLLIFGSGVSNSLELSESEFKREKNLLLDVLKTYPQKKIVYFSSCAVGLIDTPYYLHKQAMENIVIEKAELYLICRLPQVVGITQNSTLVNHIATCIRTKKTIKVISNAKRNLIDIDDAVRITILLSSCSNLIINITNGIMVPINDLIQLLSSILKIKPIIAYGTDENGITDYDGMDLKKFIGLNDRIYSDNYLQDVLTKYASQIGH